MFWGCRVKAVESFLWEDYCVMVTASNDGFIKMWKLQLKEVRLMPWSHYVTLTGFSLSGGVTGCAASHI